VAFFARLSTVSRASMQAQVRRWNTWCWKLECVVLKLVVLECVALEQVALERTVQS